MKELLERILWHISDCGYAIGWFLFGLGIFVLCLTQSASMIFGF